MSIAEHASMRAGSEAISIAEYVSMRALSSLVFCTVPAQNRSNSLLDAMGEGTLQPLNDVLLRVEASNAGLWA